MAAAAALGGAIRLGGRTQLRFGGGRPAPPRALPTRSAAACAAQTARDGGRALSVVRQRVGLGVSSQVVLAEAWRIRASAECGSLLFRNRPVLQRLRVGVLAGLHKVVQVA